MLTYSDIKTDLLRMVGSQSSTARTDISTAVTQAIQRAQERFCLSRDWGFLEQLTDRVAIPLAAPYTDGTVDVTQDSKTVTGTSTTFTKDMEGQFIQVNSQEVYEIRKFVSATELTLDIPYQSDDATAQTFSIYKRFYNLPLNYMRPSARDAKLSSPGNQSETVIAYHRDASFTDQIKQGTPQWFGILGNTRNNDYYNTGTITIATASSTSTWTGSGVVFPSDVVDREVRVSGESRSYYIDALSNSSVFTTYDTYVNPSDQTNTLSTASNYAITPKETKLVGFSDIAMQRYIFWMPYIKRPDDLILDTDVSIIVLAGYGDAFLAMCRKVLSEDARVAMRGDTVQSLMASSQAALDEAWASEQMGETAKQQGTQKRPLRIPTGPSWISR